jgi:hypothetical protein
MDNFAQAYGGRLPPAVIRDPNGKPLYSWRVLLLPFLEAGDLYKRFNLDEPWDSPHNAALLSQMPKVYSAPSPAGQGPPSSGQTYYQVFTGPGTAFEEPYGLRLPADFPDGTSMTILVVEAGTPVPWTKPADLTYQRNGPLPDLGGVFRGEGSRFNLFRRPLRGTNVVTADGMVRFLLSSVSEASWRHAIVRNDDLLPGPDW